MLFRATTAGIIAILFSVSLPGKAQPATDPSPQFLMATTAQGCQALQLADQEGTEITKTVSRPTILPLPFGGRATAGLRNNWNTDWNVPSGQTFRKFVVTLVPHTTGQYDIKMYLKYNGGQPEEFYNNQGPARLTAEQALVVDAIPRAGAQPYQVNILVGGFDAQGNQYTASVAGCR